MYKKDIEIAINNYEKRCEAKEVVLIDWWLLYKP